MWSFCVFNSWNCMMNVWIDTNKMWNIYTLHTLGTKIKINRRTSCNIIKTIEQRHKHLRCFLFFFFFFSWARDKHLLALNQFYRRSIYRCVLETNELAFVTILLLKIGNWTTKLSQLIIEMVILIVRRCAYNKLQSVANPRHLTFLNCINVRCTHSLMCW